MNAEKRRFFKLIFLLALVLNFSFAIQAQKIKPKAKQQETPVLDVKAELREYKLNSKLLAREVSYNVFLPYSYNLAEYKKARYPVIYLLHGLSGHFDNWASKTNLSQYALGPAAIVVMPEGGDGWWTDSASEPNDRYESYIIDELIPEMDKKFRTLADKKHRAVAGLSMGGYGSIKFGLKHSHLFSLVGSFSGALGATDWTEKEIGTKGAIAESILRVFGAADSKARAENNLFQMTRDIPNEMIRDLPFIYLDCGTEDFFIQNNIDFARLLREKKIPHEFRELPGGHNWTYWGAQVQEFLELSEKYVK